MIFQKLETKDLREGGLLVFFKLRVLQSYTKNIPSFQRLPSSSYHLQQKNV